MEVNIFDLKFGIVLNTVYYIARHLAHVTLLCPGNVFTSIGVTNFTVSLQLAKSIDCIGEFTAYVRNFVGQDTALG